MFYEFKKITYEYDELGLEGLEESICEYYVAISDKVDGENVRVGFLFFQKLNVDKAEREGHDMIYLDDHDGSLCAAYFHALKGREYADGLFSSVLYFDKLCIYTPYRGKGRGLKALREVLTRMSRYDGDLVAVLDADPFDFTQGQGESRIEDSQRVSEGRKALKDYYSKLSFYPVEESSSSCTMIRFVEAGRRQNGLRKRVLYW